MARKKAVRKKPAKKKVSKRVVRKKAPVRRKIAGKKVANKPKRMVRASKRKITLVLKNLILFIVLGLISFLLYSVSEKESLQNFFGILAIVLGFIALAFLLVLLILLFMRAFKK